MNRLIKILILFLAFNTAYGQVSTPDIWAYGHDSVLVLTQRILAIDPNNAMMHYSRAQAFFSKQENEAAHNELLYALECLKSKNIYAYQIKSIGDMLFFKFDDYKNASKAADYILVNDPHNIEGMEIKARSLQRMGLDDDAIKAYKSLLEYASRKTKFEKYIVGGYSCSIGESYENKHEYFKAIQYYNDAIELGDDDALAFSGRGRCKEMLSDHLGALSDLDIALNKAGSKDGFYFSILNHRTYIKGNLKRHAEVITDATGVILGSDDKQLKAYAYFLRAFAKHEMKNNAGACLDWSKAGELGEERAYTAIKELCK